MGTSNIDGDIASSRCSQKIWQDPSKSTIIYGQYLDGDIPSGKRLQNTMEKSIILQLGVGKTYEPSTAPFSPSQSLPEGAVSNNPQGGATVRNR